MSNSRIRSIIRSYRSRVAAVRGATTAPETAPAEETEDQLPKESWKKGDIIDWLLDNGIEADRSDLVGMTKAELIDNFLDDRYEEVMR